MFDLTWVVLLTFSLLRPMKSTRFGLFEVNLGYGEGDLTVLGMLCVWKWIVVERLAEWISSALTSSEQLRTVWQSEHGPILHRCTACSSQLTVWIERVLAFFFILDTWCKLVRGARSLAYWILQAEQPPVKCTKYCLSSFEDSTLHTAN